MNDNQCGRSAAEVTRMPGYVLRSLLGGGVFAAAPMAGLACVLACSSANLICLNALTGATISLLGITGRSALALGEALLVVVVSLLTLWTIYICWNWRIIRFFQLPDGQQRSYDSGFTAIYDENNQRVGYMENSKTETVTYSGPGRVAYLASKSLVLCSHQDKVWYWTFLLAGPIQALALGVLCLTCVWTTDGASGRPSFEGIFTHPTFSMCCLVIIGITSLPCFLLRTWRTGRDTCLPSAVNRISAPILTWAPIFAALYAKQTAFIANSPEESAVHGAFFVIVATSFVCLVWHLLPKQR